MKIHDDHLYHGAALTQIAEHKQFTAINAFRDGKRVSRSSFLINNDIAVYLKYATKVSTSYREHAFTFTQAHLDELTEIEKRSKKAFVALVCVKAREVCLLSRADLRSMISERRAAKGSKEDAYTVLVVAPHGKKLRAYLNAPGVKKKKLTERLVGRNEFPGKIFKESDNT